MDSFTFGAFVIFVIVYFINTIFDIEERKKISKSYLELYLRTQADVWNLQDEIKKLKEKLN